MRKLRLREVKVTYPRSHGQAMLTPMEDPVGYDEEHGLYLEGQVSLAVGSLPFWGSHRPI